MWPDDTSTGDGWNLPVGPQSDGTYASPVSMPQPVDAAGGAPGGYAQQVLDVFKFGVGAWQQQQQSQQMLDYRRWEATNAGLTQQGRTSPVSVAPGGGLTLSPLLIIGAGVILAAVLLARG